MRRAPSPSSGDSDVPLDLDQDTSTRRVDDDSRWTLEQERPLSVVEMDSCMAYVTCRRPTGSVRPRLTGKHTTSTHPGASVRGSLAESLPESVAHASVVCRDCQQTVATPEVCRDCQQTVATRDVCRDGQQTAATPAVASLCSLTGSFMSEAFNDTKWYYEGRKSDSMPTLLVFDKSPRRACVRGRKAVVTDVASQSAHSEASLPIQRADMTSPSRADSRSPSRADTRSPSRADTRSPSRADSRSPSRADTRSPLQHIASRLWSQRAETGGAVKAIGRN